MPHGMCRDQNGGSRELLAMPRQLSALSSCFVILGHIPGAPFEQDSPRMTPSLSRRACRA